MNTSKLQFTSEEQAIKQAKQDLINLMKSIQLNPHLLHEQTERLAAQRDKTNQLLFLTLSTKVKHLDDSVTRLALKEDRASEIRKKLNLIKNQWADSSGQLSSELSQQIDLTLIAKRNVQKVVTILADYENLADELEELNQRLEESDTSELADVYRKLKRYLYLYHKLIEKI